MGFHVSPDNLPLTNIPGYKQLPAFSRTEHKGGGTVIYAIEGLNINFSTIIYLSTYAQEMTFEPAGIKFKIKKADHIMIGIYRPSNQHGSVEAFLFQP